MDFNVAAKPAPALDLDWPAAPKPSHLMWAVPLGFVALALMWPGVAFGPDHDASVFLTVGAGITDGKTPYADLWDHKPPGMYLVDAIATLLPGQPWAAVWVVSILAVMLTGWHLWMLTSAGIALLATALLASYPAAQGGGLTETLATLCAAAATYWAVKDRWFVAGLLVGAALATSLQLLPATVALAILITDGRRAVMFAIGGLVVVATVVGWLAASSAIPAAWDAVVHYSEIYLGLDRSNDARYVPEVALLVLPLGVLAAVGGRPGSRLEWASVAWIVGGLLLVALNGRFFPHYFTPLLVPLSILAQRGLRRIPGTRRLAIPILIALTIGWSALAAVRNLPQHAGPVSGEMAVYLSSATDADDSVLVWGFFPAAAPLADRETAGRYPYLLPLTTPGYATPTMIDAWVADLASNPPAVIIDAEGGDFDVPPAGTAGGRNLDIVQPFRDWVHANYVPTETVADRQVYRPR
jgi:hypothetical protein